MDFSVRAQLGLAPDCNRENLRGGEGRDVTGTTRGPDQGRGQGPICPLLAWATTPGVQLRAQRPWGSEGGYLGWPYFVNHGKKKRSPTFKRLIEY